MKIEIAEIEIGEGGEVVFSVDDLSKTKTRDGRIEEVKRKAEEDKMIDRETRGRESLLTGITSLCVEKEEEEKEEEKRKKERKKQRVRVSRGEDTVLLQITSINTQSHNATP